MLFVDCITVILKELHFHFCIYRKLLLTERHFHFKIIFFTSLDSILQCQLSLKRFIYNHYRVPIFVFFFSRSAFFISSLFVFKTLYRLFFFFFLFSRTFFSVFLLYLRTNHHKPVQNETQNSLRYLSR